MKNISIVLLISISSLFIACEKTPKEKPIGAYIDTYEYNNKDGRYKFYYDNQTHEENGILVDNNSQPINGIVKSTTDWAPLISETPYVNGKANGIQKRYTINGFSLDETPIKDGKWHGIANNYQYAIDGVYSWKNPKIRNKRILKFVTPYENGTLNGIVKIYIYDDNDKIIRISKMSYKNGNLEGVVTSTTSDGILLTEETYKNNKLNGVAKYYNVGNLGFTHYYQEVKYKNGLKDGFERIYVNGRLSDEWSYKNDVLYGKQTAYRIFGMLKREDNIDDSQEKWQSTIYFNPLNKIIFFAEYYNETITEGYFINPLSNKRYELGGRQERL